MIKKMKSFKITTCSCAVAVTVSAFSPLPAFSAERVSSLKMAEHWHLIFPSGADAPRNIGSVLQTKMVWWPFENHHRLGEQAKHHFGCLIIVLVSTPWDRFRIVITGGKVPNTFILYPMPLRNMITRQYVSGSLRGDGMELMQKVYNLFGLLSFLSGYIRATKLGGGSSRKKLTHLGWSSVLKCEFLLRWWITWLSCVLSKENIASVLNFIQALERRTYRWLEWVGPSLDAVWVISTTNCALLLTQHGHAACQQLQFLVMNVRGKGSATHLREILRVSIEVAFMDMYISSYHDSGGDELART